MNSIPNKKIERFWEAQSFIEIYQEVEGTSTSWIITPETTITIKNGGWYDTTEKINTYQEVTTSIT